MKGKPLETLVRAAQAHREEIEKQQAALSSANEAIEREKRLAVDAVTKGDQEAFSKHRAAQADAESRRDYAAARISFLQAEAPVKLEDARLTWQDIAAKHNKDLAAAKAEYIKAKKKLCALYMDLVELQNTMLKTRETLASLCGGPEGQTEKERIFPADTVQLQGGVNNRACLHSSLLRTIDPDAAFVASAIFIEDPSSETASSKIHTVIDLRRPA